MQNLYILLELLLITIALLIAVSIYCYLIEYPAKRKHLLPFYVTNNELIHKVTNKSINCFLDGFINIKMFDSNNMKNR